MNVGSRTDESYAAYEEVIELLKYKRQIRSTEDSEWVCSFLTAHQHKKAI